MSTKIKSENKIKFKTVHLKFTELWQSLLFSKNRKLCHNTVNGHKEKL